MSISRRVDVAIIGGGMAGLATALALARAGASVLVIDRGLAHRLVGESLPPSARWLLEELGVWERFCLDCHLPSYGNRSVWGAPDPEDTDFVRQLGGTGWHLDRQRFEVTFAKAAAQAGTERLPNARVVACYHKPRVGWRLQLRSAELLPEVQADIVVDASGRTRWLSRHLGVRCNVYDRLIGVVGLFAPCKPSADLNSMTLIEAVENGWWYANPLPDGRLVVAYMTDADMISRDPSSRATEWNSLLAQTAHARERVERHGYQLESAPYTVPADSSRLACIGNGSWYAVGDAAAAYDPLSSQGITTALSSALRAAQAITERSRDGAQYQEWMEHTYALYLARWAGYYTLEQRWSQSPFWRRRHEVFAEFTRET